MASISHVTEIDRSSNLFTITVNYEIEGYQDPETPEYFGATRWTYQFQGLPGGSGGDAMESETVVIDLGLSATPSLQHYTLLFHAENTFSAVGVDRRWSIFVNAYDTADQTITGTAEPDTMIGGLGSDVIRGMNGSDYIDAGDGDDILSGDGGSDQLHGGAGADILIGGLGNDSYYVDNVGDIVVEREAEGADVISTWVTYTMAPETERMFLQGSDAINGTGNAGFNRIDGNVGANILSGMGGNDDVRGAAGDDTIFGGDGNDTVTGDTGADVTRGGLGDDIHVIDSRADRAIELAGEGTDTLYVIGLASYRLGVNFENLARAFDTPFVGAGNDVANRITGGLARDTLDGGLGNDTIHGGGGNDVLIGGVGADELNGGDGSDTASYAAAPAAVRVNLITGTAAGGIAAGDRLNGVENVTGSDSGDTITGNALANLLNGGAGNDTIAGHAGRDLVIGGAGADSLAGGGDFDTLSYAGSTDGVNIDLAAGTAAGGDAQGDFYSGFENVTGGNGADTLNGSSIGNALSGGAGIDILLGRHGNDVLNGGAGADSLDGGDGSDTASYSGSAAAVQIDLGILTANSGDAQGDTLIDIENAIGGDGADKLVGSEFANELSGGAGNDTIAAHGGNDVVAGGGGADSLDGGGGIDTLSYRGSSAAVFVHLDGSFIAAGDAAGDTFTGFENLEGSNSNDTLRGDLSGNTLRGLGGRDLLDGGEGNDILFGGSGPDSFSYATGDGRDVIADFIAGATSGEVIYLTLEGYDTFEQVMAAATPYGASNQHTLITFDSTMSLRLLNVAMGSLAEQNFGFEV